MASTAAAGSAQSGENFVTLTLDPKPAVELKLHTFTCTEELGRPFVIAIDVFATKAELDPASLLGGAATVRIFVPQTKQQRYFNGIVVRVTFNGAVGGEYQYLLEVRPWVWLLSYMEDCRIYQNMTVYDVITKVFTDAKFGGKFEDKRGSKESPTLEYCVQYDETQLAFVTRLMERYGLHYYFEHSESDHILCIADADTSRQKLGKIPFESVGIDKRAVQAHVFHWVNEAALQSGSVQLNDYNFTNPNEDLKVTRKLGADKFQKYEVYRYPGGYPVVATGETIAQARMQNLYAQGLVARGATNSRQALIGSTFTLSSKPPQGSSEQPKNTDYRVIASHCSITLAEVAADQSGGFIDTFECAVTAIPADKPFRPLPLTPWPVMRGPQTAKVVGTAGDEITTDKYGRIKVQFPWDRYGKSDENSSCWIRVAQTWAGAKWGTMFIPRIGQEVVVEYLDGDPDRPLVTGCVYNANMMPPDTLPDNKTRSTVKTNSSTGGGGFNELRFEDKAGSEEVFFQAQKDYNKVVLNNETVKITKDTTTTVEQGNRSVTVSQGNNSLTVSTGNDSTTVSQGNHSLTVSTGNDSTTVATGNHSLTVTAGSSTITAGQSITLSADQMITITVGGTTIELTSSSLSLLAQTLMATGESEMTLIGGMVAINP